MAQFAHISRHNPFWFVPVSNAPGVHFDDAWSYLQRREWELPMYYKQKWQRADTTKLQMESSIAPQAMKVYNAEGAVVKTIAWQSKFQGVNYGIYELDYSLSNLPDGIYFNYQQVTLGAVNWEVISEPIHLREKWPGTMGFTYYNSYNDWDVAFSTGVKFFFRVEADIPPIDMQPERDLVTAVSQSRNVSTQSGTPYRTFKLHVGEAPRIGSPGVAPWVIDTLNKIFVCDSILIEGKAYTTETGAKWERVIHRGRPLVGASIEIVEKYNNTSLSFQDATPVTQNGIVVAYDIEDSAFGGSNTISVTDIETQD